MGTVRITAWDLGGHEAVRDLWADFFTDADAIVYMVDLSDDARLTEARDALRNVLAHSEAVRDTVLLVLGNKCDLPKQVALDELGAFLELDGARGRVKDVGLFRVSMRTGAGLQVVANARGGGSVCIAQPTHLWRTHRRLSSGSRTRSE